MTQEEEERDYQPSESELQNAFALSRSEFEDDRDHVECLRHLGRYVVIARGTAYCPRTDAILGERISLIGDYATSEEAEGEANAMREHCDFEVEVLGPFRRWQEPPSPLTDEDIPF